MVRVRQFDPDLNVLDAARMRVDRTLDGCDRIAVAFSGGKDSTALLHLVRERQLERGDDRPVAAVFRDMEYVNAAVLDKVRETFALDWVDGQWLCLSQPTRTTVAGHAIEFVPWDPDREAQWLRPMPEEAIADFGRVYTPAMYDELTVSLWPGKVVIGTGLRAAESLMRYRSVANKLSEPWLTKSKAPGIQMCRPLYDWQEADVLRYLLDVGASLATIYDAQVWAGRGDLRTASLLAQEQMRDLATLEATDPDAYAALLDLDENVAVARRYDADLRDRHFIGEPPAETFLQVRRWVDRRFPDNPTARRHALSRLAFARALAEKNPDGFPPWWVQHEIARDGHGTGMMPLPVDHPKRKAAQ